MPGVTLRTTYIGIELLADTGKGRRSFSYVALDHDLKLLAVGEGSLNDVLAYAGGQAEAFVAINSPRQPNQGLMRKQEVRQQLVPPPKTTGWRNHRVAEYLMWQHNIHILPTSNQAEACPPWMQVGFDLFGQLEKTGFVPYPNEDNLRQTLEVHSHATFCALLGQAPFPRNSLEGRLQRQLVLYEQSIKVPDPMRFFEEVTTFKLLHGVLPLKDVVTPGGLDAYAAAFTAWSAATKPGEVTLLGAPEEGQIVVPVQVLKERY
jgi:hypothetical protein